ALLSLAHVEMRVVMLAGEKSSAHQGVQAGAAVPPRDEYAFVSLPIALPLDGKAVGGVLRADASAQRHKRRPDLAKSDQADARHRVAVGKLGAEWRGKQARRDFGVHAIVHEDSAVDHALDSGQAHAFWVTGSMAVH